MSRRDDGRSLRGAPLREPGAALKPTRTIGKRGAPVSRPKEPKPYRSEEYKAFVRKHSCVFCRLRRDMDSPVDAHHHGRHPVGQKTDDTRCVPLCRAHHAELTDKGAVRDSLQHVPPSEWGNVKIYTELAIALMQVELLVAWTKGERDGERRT